MNNLYVAIEGIDGAGKTTQAISVMAELERHNIRAMSVREPGSSPRTQAIRKLLLDLDSAKEPDNWTDFCLFAAAIGHSYRNVVKPLFASGAQVVLSDRSFVSTITYQGLPFTGSSAAITYPAVHQAKTIFGIQWPDRVYWLSLEPEEALKRILARREKEGMQAMPVDRFERVEFLRAVDERFASIAKQLDIVIVKIDAASDVKTITKTIVADILERLDPCHEIPH